MADAPQGTIAPSAAGAPRTVPPRKAVKAALRSAGLSARQVDALLRAGWRGLVGESAAEVDDLRERFQALAERLHHSVTRVT